jgi:hypothetical protein
MKKQTAAALLTGILVVVIAVGNRFRACVSLCFAGRNQHKGI